MRRTLKAFFALLIGCVVGGCAFSGNSVSPTERQGQISVSVFTNIQPDNESADWPLLLIGSAVNSKRFVIRARRGPVMQSQYFSDRIPPGRYRLLGLMKDRFPDQQIEPLPESLGMFDIQAGQHLDLGHVLHWQQKHSKKTDTIREPDRSGWLDEQSELHRGNAAMEIRGQLPPPADLTRTLVARPLATVSQRKGSDWRQIHAESLNPLTKAIALNNGRILAIGEQQSLFLSNVSGNRLQIINTNLKKELALLDCWIADSKLVLLASTADELVVLTGELSTLTNKKVASLNFKGYSKAKKNTGWRSFAPKTLRWSLQQRELRVSTQSGRRLFISKF